jgi:hypothetical protein
MKPHNLKPLFRAGQAWAIGTALCAAASAGGPIKITTNPGSLANDRFEHWMDIDFARLPPASNHPSDPDHLYHKTWTSPDGAAGVKFMDLKLNNVPSAGRCFTYSFQASSINSLADWKLWANIGTTNAPN